jgi:hypothetical protein
VQWRYTIGAAYTYGADAAAVAALVPAYPTITGPNITVAGVTPPTPVTIGSNPASL